MTSTGNPTRPSSFWGGAYARCDHGDRLAARRAFADLLDRIHSASDIVLFHATEEGVPTYLVDVIAAATQQPIARVMNMVGVSPTTFRRKAEAAEPLPDVAAHRVMGLLRVAATARRLLDESGDESVLNEFDLGHWLGIWMNQRMPEAGGRSPAELLRNPEGLRAIEQVLERMRGGLPA